MSGPPLPRQLTIPSRKIVDDLLNLQHPHGGSKARFFRSFGFNPDRVDEFAGALFTQGMVASQWWEQVGREGTRVIACIGPLWTPSGERPWIRTVWQMEVDETGRLVTAHPDRRREP